MKPIISLTILSIIVFSVTVFGGEWTDQEKVGSIQYKTGMSVREYITAKDGKWNYGTSSCTYLCFKSDLTEDEKDDMLALILFAKANDRYVKFTGSYSTSLDKFMAYKVKVY